MNTTPAKAEVPVNKPAVLGSSSWQMWLPCVGMALCSLLSFVDRQVLAILSPTILAETGLSAQDFGNIVFFFFVAYTIANPLWGSLLDFMGLRVGMLLAVALWSAASVSHAWMTGIIGFAVARAALGLGEGATFPGGARTAVESLPSGLRARGIATAFSGGTIGAVVTPLMIVPVAARYGWRAAFLLTGVLGIVWMIFWAAVARPPYLPAVEHKSRKISWPNPAERRFWALVSSYALTAIAIGPILTLVPLYLSRGLGVSQARLGTILWMPPLAWGIGYFFWGWAADRFAGDNKRPVGMFVLLMLCALSFGAITWTTSLVIAMFLISWGAFVSGGFQMLALKVGSYAYPREQAAMMSGIASGSWSLLNAVLSPMIGRMFDQQRYSEAFWLIAACPVAGVALWAFLGRRPESS